MDKTQKKANLYHPDVLIFLWFIPVISAINFYLTYPKLAFNAYYLLRFTIDTAQGYLAWWTVRISILYLDQKLPYENGIWKRLVLQFILTSFIGLFVIAATTELISWIATGKPAIPKFYTFDLVVISIWFYVMNGIYVGLYFYNKLSDAEAKQRDQLRAKSEGFHVRHGKQELRLPFDELTGFYVQDPYVIVCHLSGKTYYSDRSLDALETSLPGELFFRLNRQYIIHRQMVTGFRRLEYGKITVILQPTKTFPAEITVSRLKAQAFRSWFSPS